MNAPRERRMELEQFLGWLFQWHAAWLAAYTAQEPSFGEETTLEDWLGSLQAFATLQTIATPRAQR